MLAHPISSIAAMSNTTRIPSLYRAVGPLRHRLSGIVLASLSTDPASGDHYRLPSRSNWGHGRIPVPKTRITNGGGFPYRMSSGGAHLSAFVFANTHESLLPDSCELVKHCAAGFCARADFGALMLRFKGDQARKGPLVQASDGRRQQDTVPTPLVSAPPMQGLHCSDRFPKLVPYSWASYLVSGDTTPLPKRSFGKPIRSYMSRSRLLLALLCSRSCLTEPRTTRRTSTWTMQSARAARQGDPVPHGVVGILFSDAVVRRIAMLLAEQNDVWAVGRRYFQ